MDDLVLKKLYEPFDIKTKPGSQGYKYIKSIDVIDRMNKVFSGRWSTEVEHQELIEDTVLIRVRVSVGNEFSHVGYGSSSIKRFTYGDNKGKIVDLGAVFKAAEALAIRNACSRWGVGLNLEESPDEIIESSENMALNRNKTAASDFTIPETDIAKEVSISNKETRENKPKNDTPLNNFDGGLCWSSEIIGEASGAFDYSLPPFPAVKSDNTVVKDKTSVTKKNKALELEKAVENIEASFPKIPMPLAEVNKVPSVNSSDLPPKKNVDMISDVQITALRGLLSVRGMDYKKLAHDAFVDKGLDPVTVPISPEGLTYKEAVIVVKYGNELFRKNK